jgi:hypothetical protein
MLISGEYQRVEGIYKNLLPFSAQKLSVYQKYPK